MEPLMQAGQADWITLWRQMAYVAALPEGTDDVALLAPLDAWGDNAGAHSAWCKFMCI